jgi:hypothetical protein
MVSLKCNFGYRTMQKVVNAVELLIRSTVSKYNEDHPEKKFGIYISHIEKPRELLIQNRSSRIISVLNTFTISEETNGLSYVIVTIRKDKQEYSFFYSQKNKIWSSLGKREPCNINDISLTLLGLLD